MNNLERFGTKVEVLSSQYIALLDSKSHADATKYWKTHKVLNDQTYYIIMDLIIAILWYAVMEYWTLIF